MTFPTISQEGSKKEYLVTYKVTFTKRYIVEASSYEAAEDYAEDELYVDSFNVHHDDPEVDLFDTEIV